MTSENGDIDRQISELINRANQDISKVERAELSSKAERLKAHFEDRGKKVQALYDVYLAAATDVRRKSTELDYKLRLSLWQHRGAQTAFVLGLIGAVVGLLLGILGF